MSVLAEEIAYYSALNAFSNMNYTEEQKKILCLLTCLSCEEWEFS